MYYINLLITTCNDAQKIISLASSVSCFESICHKEIIKVIIDWVVCDKDNTNYENMSGEKIVQSILI